MAFRKKSDGYYYHDDRSGNNFPGRQVSFRRGGNNKNRAVRQRRDVEIVRKFLDDGDVDMGAKININRGSNSRFNPIDARKRLNNMNRSRRLSISPSCWYKVRLYHGRKYARADMIKALQNFIHPVQVLPVNVKFEDQDLTFFVDNDETARAINNAGFRLQMRDGWKVQIKVCPQMPFVELNEPLKEKIKQVMSSKFDSVSQHLDLSKFHASEEFINNDLFVPLNRQNMLAAVFQIIAESVPNLRSLNLSNNKIFSIEHFSLLKRHAPNLIGLDISKNRIRNLNMLICLQGLRLEMLNLDDNPLCDEFQDQTTYVREVRKLFRTLRQLDDIDLPPPVDFDIEETLKRLPQSHDSYLCNAEGQAFTRQFLEQYFSMYDSPNGRDALVEAYSDIAQFSMTAFSSNSNISRYILESRNLKKVSQFDRRSKLLHVGKTEIVRFLNTLPKTLHDLTSFAVDLIVFTPELISLCVCGVFRETEITVSNKTPFTRSFNRTFVLIPVGSGFNIVNDMLSVTAATSTQISKAFQITPVTLAASSPNVAPQPGPSNVTDVELNRKREMVTTLSTQTGMNVSWSEKCLDETQWDFNNALLAFTQFNKNGQIPKEAFEK